jgi:hypothetical protein
MAIPPRETRAAPGAEEPINEMPHTPDEAGPHDVPDDEVIEQTLPAASSTGGGSAAKRQPDAADDRDAGGKLHGGKRLPKQDRP